MRFSYGFAVWPVVAAMAALGACEYAGPVENPIARNLTWFSYLGGEDLKKSCGPGASDRYRFVYNGIYERQIRAYDVRMLPDGRSATVSAFARGEPDLTANGVTLGRPLGPWSGERVQATMPVQAVGDLKTALRADGFRDSRPVGVRLPSNEFYWTAVACVDGRFHSNAWLYPSERFNSLRFPAVLKEFDRTGVPFHEARPTHLQADDPTMYGGDKGEAEPFFVHLGRDGFVGTDSLL